MRTALPRQLPQHGARFFKSTQLETLKTEIAALQQAQPERNFTAACINAWLDSLRTNPDAKVVKLLMERINVRQNAFNIQSTLKAVLCKNGCENQI